MPKALLARSKNAAKYYDSDGKYLPALSQVTLLIWSREIIVKVAFPVMLVEGLRW
jgi:hypothetical protein